MEQIVRAMLPPTVVASALERRRVGHDAGHHLPELQVMRDGRSSARRGRRRPGPCVSFGRARHVTMRHPSLIG